MNLRPHGPEPSGEQAQAVAGEGLTPPATPVCTPVCGGPGTPSAASLEALAAALLGLSPEDKARLLAILTGSIDLILLPYGTALGVYALWVLLHEDGKNVFRVHPEFPAG